MSDIIGEGYGSDHNWKHSHTSGGRQTLYTCLDCGFGFWHDYPHIPDIFEAMKSFGVPEKCNMKPSAKTDSSLTPDQLAYIRAAAARWRMDEAGPMMLEALRKAEPILARLEEMDLECKIAIASVRAAIAAAE